MTVAEIKEYIDKTSKSLFKRAEELMMTRTIQEVDYNNAIKILKNTTFKRKSKIEVYDVIRGTHTVTKKDIDKALNIAYECIENQSTFERYEGSIYKSFAEQLEIIKSMLDELEQPIEIDTKKYFEQIDKLIDKEMAQHLVDHMKQALKKEIERNKYVRD